MNERCLPVLASYLITMSMIPVSIPTSTIPSSTFALRPLRRCHHHHHPNIIRRNATITTAISIIIISTILTWRPSTSSTASFVTAFRLQQPPHQTPKSLSFIVDAQRRGGKYLLAASIPSRPKSTYLSSRRSCARKDCYTYSSHHHKSSRASSSSSTIISRMTSATASSDSTATATGSLPPVAYRDEENGCVYAGVAPPGWDIENIPRQDTSSNEPMMDPPVKITDPYHWMRDDTRTNEKVLQHLKNENAYTTSITKHLTLEPDSTTSADQDTKSDATKAAAGSDSSVVMTLYNEFLSVIQESDYTTPRPYKDYVYYTRTIEDMSYKLYCRSRQNTDIPAKNVWKTSPLTNAERKVTPVYDNEEVLLNVNDLAKDQSYCAIGMSDVSPSQKYFAYTVDYTGDEICTLMILDVTKHSPTSDGTIIPEIVHENNVDDFPISGMMEWGADDTTIYYTKLDSAQRPYQVFCRTFDVDDVHKEIPNFQKYTDTLIYEDLNDSHYVSIQKSQDSKYLFIESSSKETTELYFIPLVVTASGSSDSGPPSPQVLQCIAKRRSKVLYEVDHYNGYWWITSNVDTTNPNMALYTAPAVPDCESLWNLVVMTDPNNSNQKPLFDGSIQSSLESITCFQNHIVACGRQDGLPQIWIIGEIQLPTASSSSTNPTTNNGIVMVNQFERLVFDEAAYDVMLGAHYEFETSKILVMYDSMITPTQSIEIDMYDTTQRTVLKETAVPGYDKSQYQCERKMVLSRDGTTHIPISMVYRKDVMELHQSSNQPVPVHLYGYGSYGASMECDFVASRLPLLNRNMIYIVAHVRGGSEMGRHWYEEPNGAKYLCKMNTFYDFVDVAQYLTSDVQLTTPDLLSCEGRSAGGLLIGASINIAPELFRVAILGVPFVDVVPTMIDASIPLTAGEWEEWGNPNEIKYFQYMMDYTPTLNVKVNTTYPACLLTGGLHDPRVQVMMSIRFCNKINSELFRRL